jgi:hypothetical protein
MKYSIAKNTLYVKRNIRRNCNLGQLASTVAANSLAVNAIRNDLLAKELARLLQLLGDAKIPRALPLMFHKGVSCETFRGGPEIKGFRVSKVSLKSNR